MALLQIGDMDLATELVTEIYEAQKTDFESETAQRGKRGVARYYYPQLALLDFDVACDLIRKHAYPNEIDTLHTLALTLAVMAGKTDWTSGLKKLGGRRSATMNVSSCQVLMGKHHCPTKPSCNRFTIA